MLLYGGVREIGDDESDKRKKTNNIIIKTCKRHQSQLISCVNNTPLIDVWYVRDRDREGGIKITINKKIIISPSSLALCIVLYIFLYHCSRLVSVTSCFI